ncbi:hypothetical protein OUZ56_001533 [Daphnia magna]|uniref:Uncharacterized protein n=1 Tax=Daphnia magna TaxID=35525 RepID=A0ABR0A2Z3_9CRUS|nr:hypothetical protein OUZ56_001533 [Daphnia magna]
MHRFEEDGARRRLAVAAFATATVRSAESSGVLASVDTRVLQLMPRRGPVKKRLKRTKIRKEKRFHIFPNDPEQHVESHCWSSEAAAGRCVCHRHEVDGVYIET